MNWNWTGQLLLCLCTDGVVLSSHFTNRIEYWNTFFGRVRECCLSELMLSLDCNPYFYNTDIHFKVRIRTNMVFKYKYGENRNIFHELSHFIWLRYLKTNYSPRKIIRSVFIKIFKLNCLQLRGTQLTMWLSRA